MMEKYLLLSIAALLVGSVLFFGPHLFFQKKKDILRFPDVQLEKNERIIGAEIRFQAVHLKAVFNIPPLWDTDIDLNVPTNPAFSGAIIDGAAALGTARELPEFEISRHATDSEPSVLEASIEVTKYPPGDPDLARRIKVVMVGP